MTKILLNEWAKMNKVGRRTAQTWAQKELIPAVKKDHIVIIKKKMKKYVIERNAPKPR